jgi:MFS family permease
LILYSLFMIPGGWLIDRRGPGLSLALMVGGSAVFCASTGALGFGFVPPSAVWLALLLVRAAMGLFSTPLHPGAARSIDQWFPKRETGVANGLVTGASILAYAVVHTVFGRLIDWLDWPSAFLFTGGATFILAVCWWWVSSDGLATIRHAQVESPSTDVRGCTSDLPPDISESRGRAGELVLLTMSYAAVGFSSTYSSTGCTTISVIAPDGQDQSRHYAGCRAACAAMPVSGWLMGRLSQFRGEAICSPAGEHAGQRSCLLADYWRQNRLGCALVYCGTQFRDFAACSG